MVNREHLKEGSLVINNWSGHCHQGKTGRVLNTHKPYIEVQSMDGQSLWFLRDEEINLVGGPW